MCSTAVWNSGLIIEHTHRERKSIGINSVDIYTKCYANQPNSCQNLFKSQKCQRSTRGNVQGSLKVADSTILGSWMSIQNAMAIHPIVTDIFQSGTKWWSDQQTNTAIPKAMQPAWLKAGHRKHGGVRNMKTKIPQMVFISYLTPTLTHIWLLLQIPGVERAYLSALVIFGVLVL